MRNCTNLFKNEQIHSFCFLRARFARSRIKVNQVSKVWTSLHFMEVFRSNLGALRRSTRTLANCFKVDHNTVVCRAWWLIDSIPGKHQLPIALIAIRTVPWHPQLAPDGNQQANQVTPAEQLWVGNQRPSEWRAAPRSIPRKGARDLNKKLLEHQCRSHLRQRPSTENEINDKDFWFKYIRMKFINTRFQSHNDTIANRKSIHKNLH